MVSEYVSGHWDLGLGRACKAVTGKGISYKLAKEEVGRRSSENVAREFYKGTAHDLTMLPRDVYAPFELYNKNL